MPWCIMVLLSNGISVQFFVFEWDNGFVDIALATQDHVEFVEVT